MNPTDTKKPRNKFPQLSVKFDPALRERVLAYARSACQPGTKWSFSAVVQAALAEFLTKRGF